MTLSTELPKIIIWRLVDGKVGHEKQSQAFIDALGKYYSIESTDIQVKHTSIYYLLAWLLNIKLALYPQKSPPQLVISAGHKTHLPLLATKRYHRCKALVIMSPSLPSSLFDVILAPWHDYIDQPLPNNVVITPTALARKIDSKPIKEQGLILLGGESNHYYWDSQRIAEQIKNIVSAAPEYMTWQVSTSRRTPNDTVEIIQKACAHHQTQVEVLRHQELPKQWLTLALETAGEIWITPDSPSMISEALMTNASVKLIELDEKNKKGKIIQANNHLISEGFLSQNDSETNNRKRIDLDQMIKQVIALLEI